MNHLLEIFSIFDQKAGAYLQPFFSINTETAQRELASAMTDTNSKFHQYAEDYTLFLLASFDQKTGFITVLPTPEHICNAITLKETAPIRLVADLDGITKEQAR